MNRSKIVPGDGDARHGSNNGYTNLGCRCAECREAWTAAMASWRSRRNRLPATDRRHGTLNGYTNYECRCDACRSAAATYWVEYSATKQVAS